MTLSVYVKVTVWTKYHDLHGYSNKRPADIPKPNTAIFWLILVIKSLYMWSKFQINFLLFFFLLDCEEVD